MKQIIDIKAFRFGEHDARKFVMVRGHDNANCLVRGVLCDEAAIAFNTAMEQLQVEGQTIGDQDIFVELYGGWKAGGPIKDEAGKVRFATDGSPLLDQNFVANTFYVLQGPALELARIKRDASIVLAEADLCSANGDLDTAYSLMRTFIDRSRGAESKHEAIMAINSVSQEDIAAAVYEGRDAATSTIVEVAEEADVTEARDETAVTEVSAANEGAQVEEVAVAEAAVEAKPALAKPASKGFATFAPVNSGQNDPFAVDPSESAINSAIAGEGANQAAEEVKTEPAPAKPAPKPGFGSFGNFGARPKGV